MNTSAASRHAWAPQLCARYRSAFNEGPRIGPLGAAGSVEGVDELDEVLCRSSRHEEGLEHEVMVPVHVSSVLPIDDLWAHFANDWLNAADHLGQVDRIQTLIREAEQADVLHAEASRRALNM